MNIEQTKQVAAVMTAWAEGKKIQWRAPHHTAWYDHDHEDTGWDFKSFQYRIKPQPRVIPWTQETCPVGQAIRRECDGYRAAITAVCGTRIYFGSNGSFEAESFAKGWQLETPAGLKPCGTEVTE